jgi:hypothetical protein
LERRSCELIDAQIERAVYVLYGATAADIEFIESFIAGADAPKEKRSKSWRPDTDGPVAGPRKAKGAVRGGRKAG